MNQQCHTEKNSIKDAMLSLTCRSTSCAYAATIRTTLGRSRQVVAKSFLPLTVSSSFSTSIATSYFDAPEKNRSECGTTPSHGGGPQTRFYAVWQLASYTLLLSQICQVQQEIHGKNSSNRRPRTHSLSRAMFAATARVLSTYYCT